MIGLTSAGSDDAGEELKHVIEHFQFVIEKEEVSLAT